jgi:hypothetical protein
MSDCCLSLKNFIRGHLPQIVLLVPGALLITLLHESAHALAVLWQGGSVIEFQWLPSARDWGHIRFVFPDSVKYSPAAISLAPYSLSLAWMVMGVGLAWRRRIQTDRAAAYVYFWLYFIPVVDIGFTFLVWTAGGHNDFTSAFGRPAWWSYALVAVWGLAMGVLGYVVQTRLYQRLRLGWLPYGVLVATTFLLMVGLHHFAIL